MFSFIRRNIRLGTVLSLNFRGLKARNSRGSRGMGLVGPRSLSTATESLTDGLLNSVFQYTSGRWLWDEEKQLAARYVKFDVDALCSIAAQSVGSTSCTHATKLTEGNFNKVLLLTMNDGKEVIAKVPNPNAGHPHFTTASEVATMQFVRDSLHIPAPRVFAWCSKASESPVGAEYIIMEKVPGVQLSQLWTEMHQLKKSQIVTQLVQFDQALASNPFSEYGSLYYTDHEARSDSFVVGPTTNRKYYDDGRRALGLDRGPWRSAEEYLVAAAQREKESIVHLGASPRLHGLFKGPGQYQPSTATKHRALDGYIRVSKYLLPKNLATHKPVLWHPDLHTDNIFVDPEEPTRITGVIDWQAAHIAPLFLQVRRPALLDFDGPIPESLKLPVLPENFEALSAEEKLQAKRLNVEQVLYVFYEIELLIQCRDAGNALRLRDTLGSQISGLAGSLFTDGEPIVLGYLMQVVDRWAEIVGQDPEGRPLIPCPISFTAEERSQQREDQVKWEEGVVLMDELLQKIGAYTGWDGFVSHADYETMKRRVLDAEECFLRQMATDDERSLWSKAWPFPVSS
ncbi:phosphotransferase enzyme family protein [Aspergillus coremiiformis]|uniref:Altered inheritance of mitochondria protein 9, mitochondrial n=1 Tax=Aspergillus coremiiformis TaxID=138285 RepID=A0A5N6ZGM6_9EURO|nr:phosphotransferase enzyme family protein [Aspergillus coremiiformis]